MFSNAHTMLMSHYCIFTEALQLLVTSSLPRLHFSSHRSEFSVPTFAKHKVLPRANGPIVSSGTVFPGSTWKYAGHVFSNHNQKFWSASILIVSSANDRPCKV